MDAALRGVSNNCDEYFALNPAISAAVIYLLLATALSRASAIVQAAIILCWGGGYLAILPR